MIISPGKVIVTEETVTVTEFHFGQVEVPKDSNMTSLDAGALLAIDWAMKRLQVAREEALRGSGEKGMNLFVSEP